MVQKSGVHQLRMVVYPVIYMGFYASQVVIAGFLNHQQCRRKQNDEDDSQLVLQLFFCEPGGSFFNQRDGRGRSQWFGGSTLPLDSGFGRGFLIEGDSGDAKSQEKRNRKTRWAPVTIVIKWSYGYNPYKWPEMNGFPWGEITWWRGQTLNMSCSTDFDKFVMSASNTGTPKRFQVGYGHICETLIHKKTKIGTRNTSKQTHGD